MSEQVKHYHLRIPEIVWNKLDEIAQRRNQEVDDVIKTCFKVGILAMDSEDTPGQEPLFRMPTYP